MLLHKCSEGREAGRGGRQGWSDRSLCLFQLIRKLMHLQVTGRDNKRAQRDWVGSGGGGESVGD